MFLLCGDQMKEILAVRPTAWNIVTKRLKFHPIHIASEVGKLNVVKFCMSKDPACAGLSSQHGALPLQVAIACHKKDIAMFLLKSWPQAVDAKDEDGRTPLIVAAQSGEDDIARVILELRPDAAKVLGSEKNLPLHSAAFKGFDSTSFQMSACIPPGVNSSS